MALNYVGTLVSTGSHWEYQYKNENVTIRDIGDNQYLMPPFSVILHGSGRYYAELRTKYYAIDISDNHIEKVCSVIDSYLKGVDNLFIRLDNGLPYLVTKSFIQYAIDTPLSEGKIVSILEIINNQTFIYSIHEIIAQLKNINICEEESLSFIKEIYQVVLMRNCDKTATIKDVRKTRNALRDKVASLYGELNKLEIDPSVTSLLMEVSKTKSLSAKRKKIIGEFSEAQNHDFLIYPTSYMYPPKLSELLILFSEVLDRTPLTKQLSTNDTTASISEEMYGSVNTEKVTETRFLFAFDSMFGKCDKNAIKIYELIFPDGDIASRKRDKRRMKKKLAQRGH